ncbi:MAG TPA: molybdopterin-dependent oxidoreductase [Amycolatopsis sp.]|uniref:molybdopterin-dependent oxidoreductase n=1 Tax=Amycolatopsis sp. TaxID=37632 RepID=UPI002B47DEEC|nr:molybdopterin-dependent oxidoreductase [Amycolatopsis sp.]HKS48368.1 molybdopterin-dependent oxidoreductase [Amycolatopsis sp.]
MTTELSEAPAEAPSKPSKPTAALIGVLALVAALGAGHLAAAFVGINASPYLAVGNAAIDLTPTWLKDFAAGTFGTADKTVLLAGMAVVMGLLAIVAGLISRSKPMPGQLLIGVFGVFGIIAVYTRPDLGQVSLIAPVVSLLAGVLVFRALHRAASAPIAPSSSRRRFLFAGVALGAGLAGGGGQLLGSRKDVEGSRGAVGPLVPARTAPAIPADADFARLGTPTFITSNRDFYRIDTALVVPQVRAEDWSLRIHGMVDKEVTYSYADIRDRPLVERVLTLCCVSNPVGGSYISNAKFIGVDLADLLTEAGVRPGAEQLFSTSVDGFTAGTPVPAVVDPGRGAMLAIGMNGEPLPVEHGFPARLVVPGLYGFVSATKWVTDLELTTWDARKAYWLQRGWAEQAPIKTESRIDAPSGAAPAGKVRVAGIAWAQHTGIAKVEARLDNGPWQEATLSAEVTDDAWRMWWTVFDATPGSHTATVRATDRSGYTQTDQVADVVPDGATGWHTITFTTQ